MFDDKPIPGAAGLPAQAGAPPNLPVGEPEDIFSGADAPVLPRPTSPNGELDGGQAPPSPSLSSPSALSAGAIRPRLTHVDSSAGAIGFPLREPRLSRYLMFIGLFILIVALFGGGTWFLYGSFVRAPEPIAPVDDTPSDALPPPPSENIDTTSGTSVGEDIADENILFGEPIDLDGDGLDGSREADLGTDPNNWDTDKDGLSDYEEVAVWKSDPLNADTDADGYSDGEEVKNSYNPTGPGKLFEPPTDTSS